MIQSAHRAIDQYCFLDQGNIRQPAATLAKSLALRLSCETGRSYVICLASTGTEAVELALKHALLARRHRFSQLQRQIVREYDSRCPQLAAQCWRHNEEVFYQTRPCLVALEQSFHGKTCGE